MAETFDNDLQKELARHDETFCSECGYVGECCEFEDGICPNCQNDCLENPNDEYNADEQLNK